MRSIQVNFKVVFLKNHIAQLKKPDFCNAGNKKTFNPKKCKKLLQEENKKKR